MCRTRLLVQAEDDGTGLTLNLEVMTLFLHWATFVYQVVGHTQRLVLWPLEGVDDGFFFRACKPD